MKNLLFIQHYFSLSGVVSYAGYASLLFLFSAGLGTLIGKKGNQLTARISTLVSAAALLLGLFASTSTLFGEIGISSARFSFWGFAGSEFPLPAFSILFDKPGALIFSIVLFISLVVHIYSLGYMKGEANLSRYFVFLDLFTFSMLMLVMAGNLFTLCIFWELVGFGSWLLIGFWTEKRTAGIAAQKAMILNRVGDACLLAALLIVTLVLQGGDFLGIEELAARWRNSGWITLAGLFFMGGIMGKSAQFPLQIWLPKAMAGPTPASAMIHAATMVAAGVFLLFRISPLIDPVAGFTIACIGAFTAILAGLSACVQWDIKKLLAYSTISQLGIMVVAGGLGGAQASIFHLSTHAVFKCGLFLSAGILIHAWPKGKGDPQDIRNHAQFSGVPLWFKGALLFQLAALAAIPFFSGFLSKEAILEVTAAWSFSAHNRLGALGFIPIVLLLLNSFITAYYSARLFLILFSKEVKRTIHFHSSSFMIFPALILSLFSFFIFWSFPNPFNPAQSWMLPFLGKRLDLGEVHGVVWVSLFFVGLGVFGAWFIFGLNKNPNLRTGKNTVLNLIYSHYYLDTLYDRLIAGLFFRMSRFSRWVDVHVIDGWVKGAAMLLWGAGKFSYNLVSLSWQIEKRMIDPVLLLIVDGVKTSASRLKETQSGKIQQWVIFSLILLLILVLIFSYFIV